MEQEKGLSLQLYVHHQATHHQLKLIFATLWQSRTSKCPALLKLEAHHGADLGFAYRTPDSAKAFTN